MALQMERGRTQSLFKYLPEQTYNWQGSRGSFRGSPEVDHRELDVPRAWIKRALIRLLRPFVDSARDVGRAFPGLQVIEGDRFELLEPRKFRGELYPRTFICQNCNRFFEADEKPGRVRCPSCKSQQAVQFSFVEYHKCGHLSPLLVPRCANNCNAGMKLENRESRSFIEWRWQCARCNTKASRGVYHACPNCRREQVRVLRADAGNVFHPQHVKVVNPPRRKDSLLLEAPGVARAAVAQAAGLTPRGLEELIQLVNERDSDDALQAAKKQLVHQYKVEEGSPLFEQLLKNFQDSVTTADWSAEVDALGLSDQLIEELGQECLELALASEASPITLEDLIAGANSPTYTARYDVAYRDALNRYGLTEVTLLREFPLAYVVAGFTREERSPRDSGGVIFNFFEGTDGRYPMYGQRAETEALLFRLNPAKVKDWLVKANVVDDPGEVNPRRWLFSLYRPVESIFDPPDNRITRSLLGLVHSFAHRAVKALAVGSGLSRDSLSEYLIPGNLSFIIYADTRSEFVLGGLEHVYTNHLDESLSRMAEDRRCVFDPPCREHHAACAFCMYLAETSCERFNTVLSRAYLFGGKHEGLKWPGFWNV